MAHKETRARGTDRTKVEEKLARVFADERLMLATTEIMERHAAAIRWIIHCFEGGDLPVELVGKSGIPLDGGGTRWQSVNTQEAFFAAAELVADHRPETISKAMIKRKLRSRLIDRLRASDEFQRSRQPQDGLARPTKRKKLPPTRGVVETRDATGNRAAHAVDHQRAFANLEGLGQIAYFVYMQAQYHSSDVTALWEQHLGKEQSQDGWRRFSADGPGDALETTIRFFGGLEDPARVDEALRAAHREMGAPEPAPLFDDTLLEEIDDIGEGGFLPPGGPGIAGDFRHQPFTV